MKGNVLIVHGGAPTAVINSSLYGSVAEAEKYGEMSFPIITNNGIITTLKEAIK